jgi:hypothetical protein
MQQNSLSPRAMKLRLLFVFGPALIIGILVGLYKAHKRVVLIEGESGYLVPKVITQFHRSNCKEYLQDGFRVLDRKGIFQRSAPSDLEKIKDGSTSDDIVWLRKDAARAFRAAQSKVSHLEPLSGYISWDAQAHNYCRLPNSSTCLSEHPDDSLHVKGCAVDITFGGDMTISRDRSIAPYQTIKRALLDVGFVQGSSVFDTYHYEFPCP